MNIIQGQKPCARYRPLFDSYISNELLIETTHEILRHVEECSECTYELEQRSKARELLRRSLAGVHAGEGLRARIQTSLRLPRVVTPIATRRPRTLFLQVAAALSFAVLGAVLLQFLVRDPARLAALLDLGWNQHVHCTLGGHYPANAPSQQEMVKQLGPEYASLLPVAESQLPEYRIRKAHLCHSGNREFAHLILEKGSKIVSVSILKKGDGDRLPAGVLTAARDRGEIVAFETPAHLVYIMGNQTSLEMQVVAQRIDPAIRALP
jgi:hypothetical protein